MKQQKTLKIKMQIIGFLDDLIDQFPTDHDIIIMRIIVSCNHISVVKIIEEFKRYTDNEYEWFDTINKNTFFTTTTDVNIYSKICYYRTLWNNNEIDINTKHTISKWFDVFRYLISK